MPEGLEFELYIDEKRVALIPDPLEIDDPEENSLSTGVQTYLPHLFVFASGEASVYEIRIRRPLSNKELIMRGNILRTFASHCELRWTRT